MNNIVKNNRGCFSYRETLDVPHRTGIRADRFRRGILQRDVGPPHAEGVQGQLLPDPSIRDLLVLEVEVKVRVLPELAHRDVPEIGG